MSAQRISFGGVNDIRRLLLTTGSQSTETDWAQGGKDKKKARENPAREKTGGEPYIEKGSRCLSDQTSDGEPLNERTINPLLLKK